MFFIHKKTTELIPIPQNEQKVIKQLDVSNEEEQISVIKKLLSLKKEYWLKCTCNDNAILVICSIAGNIYIRCKELHSHLMDCIFAKNRITISLKKLREHSYKKVKRYDLYKQGFSLSTNDRIISNKNTTNKSLTRLGQVLYTIIDDSKVNIVKPDNQLSILEQLTNITAAFQDSNKLITKDIPLAKYYRYVLKEETLAQAKEILQKSQNRFPHHLCPFVLFTTVVTEIADNYFITKKSGKKYFVDNIISTTSGWINKKASAPYFLLTSTILNNDEILFKDAFALPIVSTASLMPVESNYERIIYKILFNQCKQYADIEIEKPLFDIFNEDKQRFRPDFIIHIKNKYQIFIEVLGSNNSDYLIQKQNIRKVASKHCDIYLSIKAFELNHESNQFVYNLRQAINRYI